MCEDAGRLRGHECVSARAWLGPPGCLCRKRFARLGQRVWLTFRIGPGKAGCWYRNEMGAATEEGLKDGRRDMRADGGSRVWQPRAVIAHCSTRTLRTQHSGSQFLKGDYQGCRSSQR